MKDVALGAIDVLGGGLAGVGAGAYWVGVHMGSYGFRDS